MHQIQQTKLDIRPSSTGKRHFNHKHMCAAAARLEEVGGSEDLCGVMSFKRVGLRTVTSVTGVERSLHAQ